MKVRVFGPPWDAPVCDDAIREGRVDEAPIGQPCLWCDEPIKAGENGLLMAAMGMLQVGGSAYGWSIVPIHKECNIRQVVGSVGHLMHTCHCFGGTQSDPPGLTKRQAAQAVWDLFLTFKE